MRETLAKGALRLNLSLSSTALERLLRYVELIARWGSQVNLSGTKDPVQIVERHVLDSLAVTANLPGFVQRLVDVGSGAGFPGAVVAATTETHVTALEPAAKKHAFLRAVRRELQLSNFAPVPEREERHDPAVLYDAAVSRATWPLAQWLERGRRLVRTGGLVIAMEGAQRTSLAPGSTRCVYDLGSRSRALIFLPVAKG